MILQWIEENQVTPTLVNALRELGGEQGWYHDSRTMPEDYRTLSSHDFSEVLSATVHDIEEQSQSGALLDRDLFNEYLYLWKYAAGEEGPSEYLESVISAERGLPDLLHAYTTRTSSAFEGWIESPEAGERPKLRVQLLEDFGVVAKARTCAEELLREYPEQVSEEDRVLLRAFINQYLSEENAG